jgi:hypothetical protein
MTTMTQTARRLVSTSDDGGFLRLALRLDAAASGALGTLSLVAAPALSDRLGPDAGALRAIGAFLVLYAAGLVLLAALRAIPRTAAWVVVAGILAWAVGTGVAAFTVHDLTALGTAVVLAQAVAVAAFADLQWVGLRRSR